MKLLSILLFALLAIAAIASVQAGASDKITQLKARVQSGDAKPAAVPAPAAKAVAKAAAKAPCQKAPTMKLPVKLVGIADQMPGDKEANEILISHVDTDIAMNKAKSIREKHLKDSRDVIEQALNVHDNFQQFQSQVLKETTLPPEPRE